MPIEGAKELPYDSPMFNRTSCLAACLFAFPILAQAPAGIERWSRNHPAASRELGEWVRAHPDAAAKFFEWDGTHPEKSREFVTWTIDHPMEVIDVFVMTHRGWPVFDTIMERHRPAAEAFMVWARRQPRVAEALMLHPRGLQWAGNHLWREYWHLEHPRQ